MAFCHDLECPCMFLTTVHSPDHSSLDLCQCSVCSKQTGEMIFLLGQRTGLFILCCAVAGPPNFMSLSCSAEPFHVQHPSGPAGIITVGLGSKGNWYTYWCQEHYILPSTILKAVSWTLYHGLNSHIIG